MSPKFGHPGSLAAIDRLEALALEFAAAIRADWGYAETLAREANAGRNVRSPRDNAA